MSAFFPCMLLVTLMRCCNMPSGSRVAPVAGASLKVINLGTAACVPGHHKSIQWARKGVEALHREDVSQTLRSAEFLRNAEFLRQC